LQNIEIGDWKEPTPIQMQGIPTLLERRDVLASAPTGSGKSGAFCIPALLLSAASSADYYGMTQKGKKKKESRQGEIRSLLLAPSRELAHQLHREVERLGRNRPGGLTSLLLQRSNASQLGQAGGQKGLDILVSTPLRLVDVLEQKSIKLDAVRLVVLDEADRLLDATDLKGTASGSSHTKTFVSQLDSILSAIPSTAIRALFSATITPAVQELSDSILRNACHITVQSSKVGGANSDITQELLFCGREEGKLLAIRQLVARGQLHPPTLIFCQSQERAQALFSELLYDNLHVDVLHAGRSPAARETAVKNFRTGHTWVLICTDLVARGVDFAGVKLVLNYDLPASGVTYVHRIGRTGRAGRKGKAITFFTEADLDCLRTIANIMKQSGCDVPDWMLQLKKQRNRDQAQPRRLEIDTTPRYDKLKRQRKQQIIAHHKKKTESSESQSRQDSSEGN
jgi:ATP-dependent RNA helicase DDX52/ROK1